MRNRTTKSQIKFELEFYRFDMFGFLVENNDLARNRSIKSQLKFEFDFFGIVLRKISRCPR